VKVGNVLVFRAAAVRPAMKNQLERLFRSGACHPSLR